MYPLLVGGIIFILLSLYCSWLGDDVAEENAITEPTHKRRAAYQLQETSAIGIADWPTPTGQAQRGDTVFTR
jgi:hypothetical protein